ncbi:MULTISPECIES: septum formation initiator family protein [unclassified Sedimentibacter]|uniref:septum formation initiator family protein n=1 Tax=unclassified Sedimentibacter TaxID=2649220 RepID=UPI0027E0F3EA|nr:septum formation initiator family protein [Sedimentibacter sp. MB35-C1]WMJ76732.1 cell division protein FtsL [Sedimentibacter sp. MB35-C1]
MSALRKEAIDLDYGQGSVKYSPKKKRIKKAKKNINVIESFKNTAMLAVTFILGILIVYNYAVITDKQMEIHNLNQEIATLKNDADAYNITLESIKNTNSIEEMAKTYLGMNYPTRKQTVFVDFTYGSTETSEDETKSAEEKSNNILVGLIDKVVSFIQ